MKDERSVLVNAIFSSIVILFFVGCTANQFVPLCCDGGYEYRQSNVLSDDERALTRELARVAVLATYSSLETREKAILEAKILWQEERLVEVDSIEPPNYPRIHALLKGLHESRQELRELEIRGSQYMIRTAVLGEVFGAAFGGSFGANLLSLAHAFKKQERDKYWDVVRAAWQNQGTIRVLYATDRKWEGGQDSYSNSPPTTRSLEYGYSDISIPLPPAHTPGNTERPGTIEIYGIQIQGKEDPKKHVTISAYPTRLTTVKEFLGRLDQEQEPHQQKEIFVFIHGYRVTFSDAIRRTGQLASDLKIEGTPILYSWASKGTTMGYMSDEESVEETIPHLVSFLRSVAERRNTDKINIVAHSIGNRVLARALKAFLERDSISRKRQEINHVIFSNPDVPISEFKTLIKAIKGKCCKGLSIYASSGDIPLSISGALHQNPRAGRFGNHLRSLSGAGIDIIDVTEASVDVLKHSAFVSQAVLRDWQAVLRDGTPPSKRFQLQEMLEEGWSYWKMLPEK